MEIRAEVTDGILMLWGRLDRDVPLKEISLGGLDVWERLLPLLRYFSSQGPTGVTAKSNGFTITFQRPNPVHGEGTQCLTMPVQGALSRSFDEITVLVLQKTALA